jgi:hypothetical protein
MVIDAKKATISALNSGVNDRRGLGLMAMDTMMNILPGTEDPDLGCPSKRVKCRELYAEPRGRRLILSG